MKKEQLVTLLMALSDYVDGSEFKSYEMSTYVTSVDPEAVLGILPTERHLCFSRDYWLKQLETLDS